MNRQYRRNQNSALFFAGVTGIALVVASMFGFRAYASGWRKEERTKSLEAKASAASAESIDINFNVGELDLFNVDGDEVTISGEVRVKGRNERNLEQALEEAAIEFHEGQTLRVRLNDDDDRDNIERSAKLKIGIPRGKKLDLELNVGDLDADIDPAGQTKITVNVGKITLRIPENTEAKVDAEVNVGSASVSGFETSRIRSSREHIPGETVEGTIGPDENTTNKLKLTVNVGGIRVRARD